MHGPPPPRVLLVGCPPWRTECPNLALAYLSATLRRAGIDTWVGDLNILLHSRIEPQLRKYWELTTATFWARPEVFRGSFTPPVRKLLDDFVAELAEREGGLIGFSTQSANCMFTLEIVRLLRERGCRKTVVLGGPSVRLRTPGIAASVGLTGFKPQGLDEAAAERELAPYLDLVDVFVEGEGELTLLELAQRHAAGVSLDGTPGAVVWHEGNPAPFTPRPAVANLDELAAPTFEEFDLTSYGSRVLPFLTSRGCVRKCAMCYERILWPGYRHRGVEAIVAEMRHHIERYGIREFSCNDLLINGNLLFLGNLCDAVGASGLDLTWWGNAVVHRLMDRPLFERLRRGRVGAMIYGIESGSQAVLRKMRKGYIIEDADHVLRYGAEAGIQNVINLIVGFPGETEADHRDTMAFVERNREFIQHVGVLAMCIIYPHSPLAEQWEYFGLDPSSLEQFNPYSVNVDWKDLGGLDAGVRQRRFWELFRQIRGHGIGVTGVEDEEEMTPELLGKLVASLRSPTAWVREDAIVRLARAEEPSLVPEMERAMDDESFLVAGQALLNLARLAPDRAWTAAAPLLRRKASYLDYAAALALSRRLDSATMALLEDRLGREKFARHSSELKEALTPHREAYAVFETFREAAASGESTALEAVLAHPLEWVRQRSLEWLRHEGRQLLPGQRDGLLRALAVSEPGPVLEALRALRDGGLEAPREALEPLLTHDDPRVRVEAVLLAEAPRSDASAGSPTAELAGAAWPSDRSLPPGELEFRRLLAIRRAALGARPEGRSGLFCRALVEGSAAVRLAALDALLAWEDRGHAEEALASVRHAEPLLRRLAIAYLGRTREAAYELPLLPMLHDPDLFVAQEATASLARMKSVYLLRYVPELLKEERLRELPDFVREPMEPCGRLYRQAWELEGAARAGDVAAIEAAYRGASPMVRVFLLEVLRKTDSALLHRGVLLTALADPEQEVRSQALELLEFVTDPSLCQVVQPLMEDPYHRCRAWACMYEARHRHAPARPVFLRLLHDSDDYVKEWAARGLGCLADPRDLIILADLLQDHNFATLPDGAKQDLAQMYRMAHGGRNFEMDPEASSDAASTGP